MTADGGSCPMCSARGALVAIASALAAAAAVMLLQPSCATGRQSARSEAQTPPAGAFAPQEPPAPGAAEPAAQAPDAGAPEPRDLRWAVPLEEPGLPNLHKVSDDLYRGAQPSAEGMRRLKEMGVRTVVNLRSFHSDRDELGDIGLGYEHITMKAWHPEDKEVVRFLRIVSDAQRTSVFMHCKHGADRTGTMCAAYRIAVQGWTVEDAVDEMIQGGYGFHEVWRGRLGGYLRDLDFDQIRREAGLEPSPDSPDEGGG